jgi:hypothetical protein
MCWPGEANGPGNVFGEVVGRALAGTLGEGPAGPNGAGRAAR